MATKLSFGLKLQQNSSWAVFSIYFNHILTSSEDKNALHFLDKLENCNNSVLDATTMLVTYIFFTWVLTSVCPYIVHNDRFCLIFSKNHEMF